MSLILLIYIFIRYDYEKLTLPQKIKLYTITILLITSFIGLYTPELLPKQGWILLRSDELFMPLHDREKSILFVVTVIELISSIFLGYKISYGEENIPRTFKIRIDKETIKMLEAIRKSTQGIQNCLI